MAAFPDNDYVCIDGWEKIRKIGRGQFSCVTLWRNVTTKEHLVIKQCIMELDAKNKARWREEIAGLNSYRHENLVSAREVPESIARYFQGPEPCLGLEYCEGGDLRKVLNYPDNCVGLREKVVLAVLDNVSSGLAFLHRQKIIHRDLKPENILLSYIGRKTLYKITDLGYAKQLDQTSFCNSFVGTHHYIAPELYSTDAYRVVADFWSFGTMVFECITGRRPFQLDHRHQDFFRWHNLVAKKGQDDIWMEVCGTEEECRFHSVLPTPHRISRPLIGLFERWLRLAFKWNPAEREGEKYYNGESEYTDLIKQILQMQLVHVFCLSNGMTNTYKIDDTLRVEKLQVLIEKDYDISPETQDLVLPTGTFLNPDKLVISYAKEMENTEQLVFLINTRHISSTVPLIVPEDVQDMIGSPEACRAYETIKKIWGHALYFSSETAQTYKRMLQGQRALLIRLVNLNFLLTQNKENLQMQENTLQSTRSMLERSTEYDLNKFFELELQSEPKFLWVTKDLEAVLYRIRHCSWNGIADIKDDIREEQERYVAVRKNPLCGQNESELDKIKTEIRELYESHRRSDKESRSVQKCSDEMTKKVLRILKTFDFIHKEFSHHFRNIWSSCFGMERLNDLIKERISEMKHLEKQMEECLKLKQDIIWKFAKRPMNDAEQLNSSGCNSMASSIASLIERPSQKTSPYHSMTFFEDCIAWQNRIRGKMEEIRLDVDTDGEKAVKRNPKRAPMQRSKALSFSATFNQDDLRVKTGQLQRSKTDPSSHYGPG